MTHTIAAFKYAWWIARRLNRVVLTRNFWRDVPRPGYCQRCGAWAWLTNETPVYSAKYGAYLCDDCAEQNDDDTRHAWAEYHGSR